ncbi:MAG: hypothetical protein ACE5GM_03790 [bacterium]
MQNKPSFDLYRIIGLGGLSLFLVFPYCRLLSQRIFFQVIILGLLLLSLFWWNRFSAHEQAEDTSRQPPAVNDYLFCLSAVLFLFWFHQKFLSAPISWRGDEHYHIDWAQNILDAFAGNKTLLASLAGVTVTGLLLRKRIKGKPHYQVILIGTLSLIPLSLKPYINHRLVRFPPLILVTENLFANPLFSAVYSEFAHRLTVFIPYLSIFLFSFAIVRTMKIKPPLLYLLPAAIITTPLLYYHATIVYPEMLVIMIQFWVMFKIFKQEKITPPFLFELAALSSVTGTAKINALPFLLSVFVFIAIKIAGNQDIYRDLPGREKRRLILKSGYLIFLPISLYLFFRIASGDPRPYAFEFGNLFTLSTYHTYWSAIQQQLTIPFFAFSCLGLIYLAFSRKCLNAVLAACLNLTFYFMLVTPVKALYIGYSRYMLHFLPTFYVGIVGFGLLITDVSSKIKMHRYVSSLFLLATIAFNIYASPRDFRNRSNWGNYNYDTAEYYLPYPQTIKYISLNYTENTTFMARSTYYYDFPYYLVKFGLKPKFCTQLVDKRSTPPRKFSIDDLNNSIKLAKRKKFDLFLLQNLYSAVPIKDNLPNATFIKRFTLGEHCLDLYELMNRRKPVWVDLFRNYQG